jgi:hypothetical protein
MNLFVAMIITFACYFGIIADGFSFDSQVGIVDANAEGRLCLNISNSQLNDGTEVSLILAHKPQRVAKAVISGKADRSCSRTIDTGESASFYYLQLVTKESVDLSEPLPQQSQLSVQQNQF